MKEVAAVTILLLLAILIQVSWVPLPLGLLVILWLFSTKGTKYIIVPLLAFGLVLAALSQIPAWLVLLATTLSCYLFILGKSFLPSRLPVNASLVVISLVAWEALLVGLLRALRL